MHRKHHTMSIPKLANRLYKLHDEIASEDCPGNIHADIPALVFVDLAALTIQQWEGIRPKMSSSELLAMICGSLAYMFDWWDDDNDKQTAERVHAVIQALDALTTPALRPRLFSFEETDRA